MPALLTNTSSPPSSSISRSMVTAQEGKSVVSSCLMKALPPWDFTSSAVASAPAESECHVTPTSMPLWARATAVALPMPESDAVTMA